MRSNSGSSSFASARLEKSYSSENSILEARSDSGVKRQAAAKRLNGPCTRLRSIASPGRLRFRVVNDWRRDRKSTRLNSSHSQISYAVFCLKKKKNDERTASVPTTSLTNRYPRPHRGLTSASR